MQMSYKLVYLHGQQIELLQVLLERVRAQQGPECRVAQAPVCRPHGRMCA